MKINLIIQKNTLSDQEGNWVMRFFDETGAYNNPISYWDKFPSLRKILWTIDLYFCPQCGDLLHYGVNSAICPNCLWDSASLKTA